MKTCAVDSVFYFRAFRGTCECTWKNRSISSDSPAQREIKDTINEVKYGRLLFTCGNIHEGHEWFSNDSRGRQGIFMCLAVLLQIRGWRYQDIYHVRLQEIIFFVSVYSAAVKC